MNIYLIIIISVIVGSYLLSSIVDWLNVSHFSEELPQEFEGIFENEKYKKSQQYLKETSRFGMVEQIFSTVVLITFIFVGGFNMVDQWARGFGWGEILTGLLFAFVLMVGQQIINIPFSLYSTFIIEEKYGFNKSTMGTFVSDLIKGLILTVIIGGLLFSGIIWFFQKTGDHAWLYCWLAVSGFQLLLMFIAPVVIMPLFNKFTSLKEGELKTAIDKYAREQQFQMQGIFTVDGSKRSSKANAFFTGFGKSRRIALFDTLIDDLNIPELVAVLAHEVGHYKKKHILKSLVFSLITSGFMFYVLSFFMNNVGLFDAFKMQNVSIYAGLFFFGFLYAPMSMLLSIVNHMMSRKAEFEADAFAVESYGNPEAMVDALKKLSVNNLSNLTPHPLKVFLEYSHPPVLDRIEAIRKVKL